MDSLVLIDKIDDLVHNAPGIPWRSAVRMDRDELVRDVSDLRDAVRHELPDPERSQCWPLLERLQALVQAAEPVRLLGGVRVSRDEIYDLLDQLRATLPEDIWRARHPDGPPPHG